VSIPEAQLQIPTLWKYIFNLYLDTWSYLASISPGPAPSMSDYCFKKRKRRREI